MQHRVSLKSFKKIRKEDRAKKNKRSTWRVTQFREITFMSSVIAFDETWGMSSRAHVESRQSWSFRILGGRFSSLETGCGVSWFRTNESWKMDLVERLHEKNIIKSKFENYINNAVILGCLYDSDKKSEY